MQDSAFDTQLYLKHQIRAFNKRIELYTAGPTVIEFGGKPFGDYHAQRVLPGYDADCKAQILRELSDHCKIVMVVNARDIIPRPTGRHNNGRLRGDSQLRYDSETLRLVRQSQTFGFSISDVVLSVVPRCLSNNHADLLHKYRERLSNEGVTAHTHFEIPVYPDCSIIDDGESAFGMNDIVADGHCNLVVLSPGGGSGKFGVLLSEMYHMLKKGVTPTFIKFETFPILRVKPSHPLNYAFEAATADLGNRVVSVTDISTSYDKDIENFELLQKLFAHLPAHPVTMMKNSSDMSVNEIIEGITDIDKVVAACAREIERRIQRYIREFQTGDERQETVQRAQEIYTLFQAGENYV